MRDKQLLLVSFFILLVVAVGLLIGLLQKPVCPVAAMDLPVSTSAPTVTPAPTVTINQVQPAVVATVEQGETTYMYRLDEFGHAIWRVAGELPPGALVKRSGCWTDGFAQVEYRDPSRPNRWLVQYVKCEGK